MFFDSFFEVFILCFFGFFTVEGPRGKFFRQAYLAKLSTLLQVTVLSICRFFYCGFTLSRVLGIQTFINIFMVLYLYGFLISLVYALFVISWRGERFCRIVNEIRRLGEDVWSAGCLRVKDSNLRIIFTFHMMQACGSFYVGMRCSLWRVDQCLNCVFTGMMFNYYNLMISLLFAMIAINLTHLLRIVNRSLRGSARGKVKSLRALHHRITDLIQDTNHFFSDINLATFFIEFVVSVCAITFLIIRTDTRMVTLYWMYSYAQNMFLRTFFSCKLYWEADKTANYLNELMIENDDPDVREEIEIFSLQLLHRRVEFDACGFFKLDFTLLTSMIGAVTTYIIILIQFQIAGKNNVGCESGNITAAVM